MNAKPIKLESILFRLVVMPLVLGLALSGLGAAQSRAAEPSPGGAPAQLIYPSSGNIVPDKYIVVYKNDFEIGTLGTAIQTVTAYGGQVEFVYHSALHGFSAYLPKPALDRVLLDPAVAYVEADAVISLDPLEHKESPEDLSDAAEPGEIGIQTVQTGATWGLDRIDQVNLPLSTTYIYNHLGTNVHAYVIDTGIRSTHTEFGARASKDFDGVGDGQNGNDCHGHGTHVAGTIGGKTYGVAKQVRIHGVRVLNCDGWGYWSWVIAGLDWVAAHHLKPAVANMSLGSEGNVTSVNDAVKTLINKGVVVVVAAGNDYANACGYSPALVPKAITVGSTTSSDARSWFSNWGSCLDIFAPGSSITSAWNTNNTATNTIDGTSMAAPHVAGVAALYLQMKPTATVAEVTGGIINVATAGKVTDPKTGSPSLILFSRRVVTPKTVTPSGTITTRKPVFKWTAVFGATAYRLEIYKDTTNLHTLVVQTSACTPNTCSFTITTNLPYAGLKWRVQAKVDGVWKTYSAFKTIKIVS